MRAISKIFKSLAVIAVMVTAAHAGDNALFNYQGRVMVQGWPYTGAGQMKAVILATTGTSTISLWSNDGSSVAGSEPTGGFAVNAVEGVFDVMIGDTELGQQALPAILFNRDDELKVRVWFNDGTHGFQQLVPDRRLTNPRRLGLTRVTQPMQLFVNSTLGNDANNGLTTATAKRTAQAALDMLPKSIYANTTVTLAAGNYEPFCVVGFKDCFAPLIINGDRVNDPYLGQTPNVTINGPASATGLVVTASHNVILYGLAVSHCNVGIEIYGSTAIRTYHCSTTYNYWGGIDYHHLSDGTMDHCYTAYNGRGVEVGNASYLDLWTSTLENNGTGLMVYWTSGVGFGAPVTIRNNSQYGILSRYNCAMAASTAVTFSGNAMNTSIASGSAMY